MRPSRRQLVGCHRGVSAGWNGRNRGGYGEFLGPLRLRKTGRRLGPLVCLEHRVQSIRELIGGLIEPS